MTRRATIVLGIVLSIVLLFYALRDVSTAELIGHLGQANFWLLFAATVVATLTFHLRAIRWRVLLAPTGYQLPFVSRYAAVCIGFMVNNVLPARIGEFARAYSLSRIEPVGISAALASLVVERLLDAIILITFLVFAILFGVGEASVSGAVSGIFAAVVIGVGIVLVTLGILVRSPNRFLRFVERWFHRFGPRSLAEKVNIILVSFVAGLGALKHAHVFVRAFLWSVVVWGWNAFSFYLGFLAFGILEPGIPGALFLQTVISFAVAIPSTPGFFGPFEAATRFALEIYNIEPSRIISFAAGYHLLTFIPITILGIWYMRKLGISRDELGHSDEVARVESDPKQVEDFSSLHSDRDRLTLSQPE